MTTLGLLTYHLILRLRAYPGQLESWLHVLCSGWWEPSGQGAWSVMLNITEDMARQWERCHSFSLVELKQSSGIRMARVWPFSRYAACIFRKIILLWWCGPSLRRTTMTSSYQAELDRKNEAPGSSGVRPIRCLPLGLKKGPFISLTKKRKGVFLI